MTTHTFRIIPSRPRMYAFTGSKNGGKTPAPRLTFAARLLSKLTNLTTNRCTVIINEGLHFKCEFRGIVQNCETLLDFGYRVVVVPKIQSRSDESWLDGLN